MAISYDLRINDSTRISETVSSLPLGFIFYSANGSSTFTGALPLTGGLYSRSTYSTLWSYINTKTGDVISDSDWNTKKSSNSTVPYYSSGDGSTTFRVPNITTVPSTGGKWYVNALGYITNVGSTDVSTLYTDCYKVSGGTITGDVTINKALKVTGDVTCSGSITGSKVYNAYYNDYAEFFPRGEKTEPGDIIALDMDSDEERYVRATEHSRVVGVHSNEFAMLIGGKPVPVGEDFYKYNLKDYIPVSLVGRVTVKVRGLVKRGDLLVCSATRGVGRVYDESKDSPVDIFGMCVEGSDRDDLHTVKVLLR